MWMGAAFKMSSIFHLLGEENRGAPHRLTAGRMRKSKFPEDLGWNTEDERRKGRGRTAHQRGVRRDGLPGHWELGMKLRA